MKRAYPVLASTTDQSVVRAIQTAYDKLYDALDSIEVIQSTPPPKIPTPTETRKQLSVAGSAALNVTGLPGRLSDPQYAYVPLYTSTPLRSDPISIDGALASVNQVLYRFNGNPIPGTWIPQAAVGVILRGPYATRDTDYPPTSYPAGTQFQATDSTIHVTWTTDGTNWKYSYGVMYGTLSPDQKPTLTANDSGFLFYATDYMHLYEWQRPGTGAAWDFAFGDDSGYTVIGKSDGSAPNGGLWGLCDGSSYLVAQSNGTLSSTSTPDATGNRVVQANGSNATTTRLATRAQWEATAKTDDESTHTHSADGTLVTDTDGDHFHSVSVSNIVVQSGTGTGVGQSNTYFTDTQGAHLHDVSGDTSAGTAHNHTLSDSNAQLKKFSESDGGMPARVTMSFYMRR